MGALHAGHISLLAEAQREQAFAVCSIFVNPTQFNDPADFARYPQTIEQDIRRLTMAQADLLFWPAVDEIYPQGMKGLETYDLGSLDSVAEGRYRPGHFQGVCQVMSRLLALVDPDRLFMGQKDFQQGLVVGQLLSLMNSRTQLITCPTVREPDGLAMSSRNARLSAADRSRAPAIYQALRLISRELAPGAVSDLLDRARADLAYAGFRVDYIVIADRKTLEPVTNWDGAKPIIALAAAFLGELRLIDNLLLPEVDVRAYP